MTDNLSGVTEFAYDAQGNMVEMEDEANNVTTIEYDLLGRKTETDDPDKGVWTYEYNAFGDLLVQEDALEQLQEMTYDGLGRMLTRIDRRTNNSIEGESTWTYDTAAYGLGQLASVQDTETGYMRAVLYDSLGRASEVVTTFDSVTYYEKTTYDGIGRVSKVFDAAGDGSYTDMGVVHNYNAYGYLEEIADVIQHSGNPRTVYRKVMAMNARGQVTEEERGIDNTVMSPEASVSVDYGYDSETGRLLTINSINAQDVDVQDLEYEWDTLGNLESREERSGSKNLSESFDYDGLNRLTSQTVAGQSAVTITYNAIGNILTKSDVGTYTYGAAGAGPHAVTAAGGATYTYDANGNNETGDGRTITYATFDKPTLISKGGHSTSFAYDPDRKRYRRVDTDTGGTTTTRYVGNVEIIFKPNGDQDRKRYIAGVAVETIHFGSNSIEDYRETHYLHKDHLGSLDVITDDSGAIIQELSFDAWGQRRNATDWTALTALQLTTFNHSLTTRGFTGHEMLDEVGVVHMNGRIYDPKLARFLQADPFIQDPMNTQSLNRYSYVWNNPLNATDPSGYIIFSLVAGLALAGEALSIPTLIAAFSFAGTMDAMAAGADFRNALQSGLIAGVSAGAFAAVGSGLQASRFSGTFAGGLNEIGFSLKVLAHGTIGGITNVLQGGKFGQGFSAAGFTAAATSFNNRHHLGNKNGPSRLRVVVAAVIGGTASRISGGKFANGAVTAAMGQALNGESGLSEKEADHAQKEMSRKQCVLNGGGCNFSVAENPNADGSAPWYEVGAMSPVDDYALTIQMSADAFGVDPKLISSIMFVETTHGYYDALLSPFGMNKSILPMNINVGYWGDAFGSREFLSNPHHNIWAGAKMLSSIQASMPNASIAQIATVYNYVNATRVSDYGARVSEIYSGN